MFEDYTIVKKYSDTLYKITNFNSIYDGNTKNVSQVQFEKDEKERFKSAISRAKSDIFDLALCNDWEYFGTFTISAEHLRQI